MKATYTIHHYGTFIQETQSGLRKCPLNRGIPFDILKTNKVYPYEKRQ